MLASLLSRIEHALRHSGLTIGSQREISSAGLRACRYNVFNDALKPAIAINRLSRQLRRVSS